MAQTGCSGGKWGWKMRHVLIWWLIIYVAAEDGWGHAWNQAEDDSRRRNEGNVMGGTVWGWLKKEACMKALGWGRCQWWKRRKGRVRKRSRHKKIGMGGDDDEGEEHWWWSRWWHWRDSSSEYVKSGRGNKPGGVRDVGGRDEEAMGQKRGSRMKRKGRRAEQRSRRVRRNLE
jgi:hypothetical protein